MCVTVVTRFKRGYHLGRVKFKTSRRKGARECTNRVYTNQVGSMANGDILPNGQISPGTNALELEGLRICGIYGRLESGAEQWSAISGGVMQISAVGDYL